MRTNVQQKQLIRGCTIYRNDVLLDKENLIAF